MVATANFKLAPGPIATARAVLDALNWDEDTSRLADLMSKWFRCNMCTYGVCEMTFKDLVSTYKSSEPLCETLWADFTRVTAPSLPEAHYTIRRVHR